jgi:hypothetical protein
MNIIDVLFDNTGALLKLFPSEINTKDSFREKGRRQFYSAEKHFVR